MLKEKDSEINYLRETMEQNEQVIFKVRLPQIEINIGEKNPFGKLMCQKSLGQRESPFPS